MYIVLPDPVIVVSVGFALRDLIITALGLGLVSGKETIGKIEIIEIILWISFYCGSAARGCVCHVCDHSCKRKYLQVEYYCASNDDCVDNSLLWVQYFRDWDVGTAHLFLALECHYIRVP